MKLMERGKCGKANLSSVAVGVRDVRCEFIYLFSSVLYKQVIIYLRLVHKMRFPNSLDKILVIWHKEQLASTSEFLNQWCHRSLQFSIVGFIKVGFI